MDGLNDGLELEEDVGSLEGDALNRVFDNPEVGEVPDLNPELEIITAVTNSVNDLNLLREDLTQTGGMDQSFALECENLIPNFLNARRPLAMFTKTPTRTNYSLALELIEEEQKSLTQRLIATLRSLIDKAIAWLKSVWAKLSEARAKKKAEEAHEYFTEDSDATQEQLTCLHRAYADPGAAVDRVQRLAEDKTRPELKNYVGSLQQRLTEGSDRLENLYHQINGSDMLYHLMVSSDVYKNVMKVCLNVETILSSLRQLDEKTMKEFMDLNEAPAGLQAKAQNVLDSLSRLARHYGTGTFHDQDLALKATLRQRDVHITSKTHPLNQIYINMAKTFAGFSSDEFLRSINAAIHQLANLRQKFDQIAQMGTRLDSKDRQRQGYGFVTELYKAIYGEFRGVVQILTAANQMHHDWTLVAAILRGYTADFHRRVSTHLSHVDEPTRKLIKEYFGVPDAEDD